jgi:small subunit ribosomal protein S9
MNNIDLTYSGIGKRKTSVAKIFLKEGLGKITVNGKSFEESFVTMKEERELIKNPLILVNLNNTYDIDIKVKGGGMNSQLDAVKLAMAKAICTINSEYRPILNQELLLRRDSRIKERRKYGLKKARKAPQYSKR